METPDPHLVAIISLTAGLAVAMIRLGRSKDVLEEPDRRPCPACGRLVSPGRYCPCGG
jgi:hypothetical protein